MIVESGLKPGKTFVLPVFGDHAFEWSDAINSSGFKHVIYAVVGAVPGILIALTISRSPGIAVSLIGAIIGMLFAIPEVSPARSLRQFFAILFIRNVPLVGKEALDKADGDDRLAPQGDAVLEWLMADDARGPRHGWFVLAALLLGVAGSLLLGLSDYEKIQGGESGFILPFKGAKDPLSTQVVLLGLLGGVWGAGLAGVIVSTGYRRPILFAGMVGAGFGGVIGVAMLNSPSATSPFSFMVFTSAFGIVIGLLVGMGFGFAGSSLPEGLDAEVECPIEKGEMRSDDEP